jgi:hypothetical protein
MTEASFQTQIYNDLEEMPNRLKFPDKSNTGYALGLLFMWKRVSDLAEKKYESLRKLYIEEELVRDPKKFTAPGTYALAEAASLKMEVNVSQPRKEFNMEWFCKTLQKRYKVPPAITRQIYEEAKQPGEVQNRTVTVKEKGAA